MELCKAQELAQQLLELQQTPQSDKLRLIQQRQILEQIYKELTADAPASFHGLFARMQYYHDLSGMPETLISQINSLRILCNKVAHDELHSIPEGASQSGALCIYALLKHTCAELELPELDEILTAANAFARRAPSQKTSFSCILLDWKYQEQSGQKSALELSAWNEDGQKLIIILRDDIKNTTKTKYTTLYPSLWKYAVLNCLNLSVVAGKEHYYIDNPQTLLVLEPDFLLDASAVAECMDKDISHPELFMLSRLFAERSSDKMLLGQMVNSMFDALIHEPEQEYPELFKNALDASPIPMVALGKDTALNMYQSIEKEHLPQLRLFGAGMRDKDLLLEPSYLCPTYGLQGRLDLLYRDSRKFSIVELKSGKAHPRDAWPQQIFQVVAYNMIIRSAYGAEAVGSSSILYSATGDKSLRNVTNIPLLEQQLIHCRNRIVGIMHLLCENPARFFDWLKRQSPDAYSPHMHERIQRLKRIYNGLRDFESEWFMEQIKRLSREIWQVKLGSSSLNDEKYYGHNALWQLSMEEKAGKIITGMRVCVNDQRSLSLTLPLQQDVTDFRAGDIVILYDQTRRIDQQEIIRGVIESMDEVQIQLRIRAGVKNNRRFGEDAKWALEHDTLESFLYAPFNSVSSFLEADPSVRDLLFGLKQPSFTASISSGEEMPDLLDRMHKAKELHIIQGPPGTGKTSGLLSSYIESLFNCGDKRMMVLSFTNRAVDEICMCLQRKNIPFIRTGNSQVIEEALLNNLIRGKRFAEIEELIKQNRIFVSTVQSANAYYRDLRAIVEIDEMIIDEASQILEPNILGLISSAEKCILIGDQNQLPAISAQSPLPFAFKHPQLQDLCYGSINQSLMERLFRRYEALGWHSHKDMLKAHYRMHDEIAGLVAGYYNNQLLSVKVSQKEELSAKLPDAKLDTRLLWIETPISTEDYYDPLQVRIIAKLIQIFGDAGLINDPERDLGIVAPYKAMIHALRNEIKNITIDTVERFQGSERRTIILCLPFRKSYSLKHMQSLSDDGQVDRKLNVAISRAMERLIIVGNIALCQPAKHYHELYNHIRERGQIIKYQELGVTNGKPAPPKPIEH